MRSLVLAVAVLMLLPAALCAQSQIFMDGFESGTLSNWTASVTSPIGQAAQVYDSAGARIDEVYNDGGTWAFRDSGLVAANPGVRMGDYSMGWFRTGPYPNQQYTWVSHYLNVIPGEYNVSAVWDVACYYSNPNEWWGLGAKFFILVGSDVGAYNIGNDPLTDPYSVRRTVWNQDSQGSWLTRVLDPRTLITNDGVIEIRLLMHDKFDNVMPKYQFAAFDNIYVELEAVNLIPEPGSLLALASGVVGLGGLAVRRRK